jgi:hypothetical protein
VPAGMLMEGWAALGHAGDGAPTFDGGFIGVQERAVLHVVIGLQPGGILEPEDWWQGHPRHTGTRTASHWPGLVGYFGGASSGPSSRHRSLINATGLKDGSNPFPRAVRGVSFPGTTSSQLPPPPLKECESADQQGTERFRAGTGRDVRTPSK